MKTRFLLIVALATFSIVLTAQTNEMKPAVKPGIMVKGMPLDQRQRAPLAMLNLSEEQKETIKQSMLSMHKKIQPVRNLLREAAAHQRTLMTAEKPDVKAINKNIERIGELKVEMAKIVAGHRVDMRAMLTDEQRMKLDTQRGKIYQRRGRMARQNR